MKVFKFGGASLKSAKGVKQVYSIIKSSLNTPLVVVVSAMGKTTNALEAILALHKQHKNIDADLQALKEFHYTIMKDLSFNSAAAKEEVDVVFDELVSELKQNDDIDKVYDQVISKGELISSLIVHHFLLAQGIASHWLDARTCIKTDATYREGKIDWESTTQKINQLNFSKPNHFYITQGFIGSSPDGYTTTLGREGSDFTAAIFAYCLNASDVTIWKDVPGVMNADPKRLKAAITFKELPFKEAAEMTYYGASVIHPKTIKPLANKDIPLYVRSFDDPTLPGTKIHNCTVAELPPLIVFKENQCLVSCRVTDYTFINEHQLTYIFHSLTELDMHANVMQNSAISFSFCLDYRENKILALIHKLKEHFDVFYNTGLTLITVKNYDEATFNTYRNHSGVLLEQSSRSTLQVLVKLAAS